MNSYIIRPADILFFRDGRAIAPGSEYSASSLFPPHPTTLYGALRTLLITSNENSDIFKDDFNLEGELHKLVGTQKKLGELIINAFGLAKVTQSGALPLYPLPLDITKRKKPKTNSEEEVVLSSPLDTTHLGFQSNTSIKGMSPNWIKHEEGSFFEHQTVFLPKEYFELYRLGELGEKSNKASLHHWLLNTFKEDKSGGGKVFTNEPRIGIGIDTNLNTVKESALFTTPYIRTNDDKDMNIGFYLGLNAELPIEQNSLIFKWGGDGKIASIRPFILNTTDSSSMKKKLISSINKTNRFKIVLSTHAIFDHGWVPDGLDPKTGKGSINGCKVQLIGAQIGKKVSIGGWDVANKKPKLTHRAVPAGSVYYFETNENAESLYNAMNGKSILETIDFNKQGLGITHLGVI